MAGDDHNTVAEVDHNTVAEVEIERALAYMAQDLEKMTPAQFRGWLDVADSLAVATIEPDWRPDDPRQRTLVRVYRALCRKN